jgi:hypothetical protein
LLVSVPKFACLTEALSRSFPAEAAGPSPYSDSLFALLRNGDHKRSWKMYLYRVELKGLLFWTLVTVVRSQKTFIGQVPSLPAGTVITR